jgi:hypothetical protein
MLQASDGGPHSDDLAKETSNHTVNLFANANFKDNASDATHQNVLLLSES